jgi:hypothetical protein
MKHISTLTLLLTLATATIHAKDVHVEMNFSGSGTYLAPPINLVAGGNSGVSEVLFGGDGSLGPFTQRELGATTVIPTGMGCAGSNSIAFTFVAGAGIYRFNDGSLLIYKLKTGTICINLATATAANTISVEITGGTGRFNNASGILTAVSTANYPILFDATGNPVMVVIPSGKVTGTIVLQDND